MERKNAFHPNGSENFEFSDSKQEAGKVEDNQESFKELIVGCSSFEQLKQVIEDNNIELQGSHQPFSKEMLLSVVEMVKQGEMPADLATRTGGFRKKLIEFSQTNNAKSVELESIEKQSAPEKIELDKNSDQNSNPETGSDFMIREVKQVIDGSDTVKSGEHLIVHQAQDSIFVVEDGAKLTIDQGMDCKVTKHGSAQVEIKKGIDNEIVDA